MKKEMLWMDGLVEANKEVVVTERRRKETQDRGGTSTKQGVGGGEARKERDRPRQSVQCREDVPNVH